MADFSKLSDEDLTALLKAGNHIAYAEIYNRYKNPLYLHAYRMLNDVEESRDIVQEMFAVIWAKREQLKITSTLDAYLYGAIKNRILNYIAHQKVINKYTDALDQYFKVGTPLNDERMLEKELAEIIEREIAQLPEKMKVIFEMSRKKGFSNKQIAEKLGISDKTVKSQIYNATKILRPKIDLSIFFIFM
jgi:RNA polymerase sigma-70 factor (ECF subfamily)